MANPSTLTPQQIAQLAQLKDIQLPEPISGVAAWWPLALGWWILLISGLIFVLTIIAWTSRRRKSVLRVALATLSALSELPNLSPIALAEVLSELLRRVAIQQHGSWVATLSGESWVEFLSKNNEMPSHVANYLAHAPYSPPEEVMDADILCQAVERWIRRQKKTRRGRV